jgi:putative salt-induced outer membrane protein
MASKDVMERRPHMANSSRPWFSPVALAAGLASAGFATGAAAFAQSAPAPPTGVPPPDATALVAAPKDPLSVPDVKKPLDGTSLSLSAGGQYATGNTRLLAATVNGQYESRWGNNGIGASLLGNYGQGAPPGANIVETAENVQGRFRYDRYVLDQASVFLINTVRHDRLQGLEVRYNLDPGFKYLFLTASTNTLWVEAGYDFQYDVREDAARVQFDATGAPLPGLLPKTQVDHAIRLYAGFKHDFNEEVTLSTGLEYIQSVSDGTHHWLNYDALFAAKVGGGLAVGLGFSARYDSDPLPQKKSLDTASTVSLIYSFSDATPPKTPDVPCAPPPPTPPPAPPPATPATPGTNPPADAPVTTGVAPAPATMAPPATNPPPPAPTPTPTP